MTTTTAQITRPFSMSRSRWMGILFLGIGLGGLFGWGVTGAFILIAIGLYIVYRILTRERRE